MSTVTGGPSISTDGLVLYLNAADVDSYPGTGNIWYDLSRNGNNVTLVNNPTFNTSGSGCFSFNGTTQYATINSNLSLSISTPTMIVTCTTDTGTVLAKGAYGCCWNYGLLGLKTTEYKVRQQSSDPVSPTFVSSTSAFNTYAAAWDGSNIQYYRNGTYGGGSNSGYAPYATNEYYLRIGCAYDGNGLTNVEFYSGKIATIQIYNRTLSSTEILQNYNAIKGRFGL